MRDWPIQNVKNAKEDHLDPCLVAPLPWTSWTAKGSLPGGGSLLGGGMGLSTFNFHTGECPVCLKHKENSERHQNNPVSNRVIS